MNNYRILNKKVFRSGYYSLVPIRMEDRFDIMKWRNDQIYHLRQNKPLEKEDQDLYFNSVVSKLFEQERPEQILFSYLEDEKCIGYGGLVHINWTDKNAEISFIIDTKREEVEFKQHWIRFLKLIQDVAFSDLKLHKIYTYAHDLRPRLYDALEKAGLKKEAILREHVINENIYIDVVIHSLINE